ncbi:MAG: hypothetical protein R3A45_02965 [Bdellovibrionota bacterium]
MTITLSVNDGSSDDDLDPLADQTVTATVNDDDAPGFTVTESGGGTSVGENGGTDTLQSYWMYNQHLVCSCSKFK